MGRKNYRDMSDEELEAWRKEKIEGNPNRNLREEHSRALRTMQNPIRREILTLLKDNALSLEKLAEALKLDDDTLQYHLQFLKDIFFIVINDNIVDLTPPGIAYTRNVL
ncbi:MAG TPA: winged helix-turn-helix domain-containing protein [Candidatus Deferrimicrobium sp.]|nr:winged helix-turn-helix domain-containing protein [Candidatus Deferrimicrobium sp.]